MIIKRRKGNLSINVFMCIIFLTSSIISCTMIIKKLNDFKTINMELVKNDYDAELAESVVRLNFYYAIEEAYNNTNSELEFKEAFSRFESEYFNNIFEKKYFNNENSFISNVEKSKEYSNIYMEEDYIDFFLMIKYKKEGITRDSIRKCRIKNPYRSIEGLNENKRELEEDEVKNLFMILY
ncbi:hypothetical protein [Peptostreptococcus faecalis]|uniref:hypothetical protein n=1 Tax=Peptostreptococcus faecalis TaxID=2045015 RepID=UPI000C7DC1D0|nr:hypothetical protein [Peptostreptococcus faecalis]